MTRIFEILNAGGIFMYGILTTSIVSLGIVLHRLYCLWFKFRLNANRLHAEVSGFVGSGDYNRALQACSGDHPVQVMIRAALLRANRSEKEIRRALETAAVDEVARYRRGTSALPHLANLATLLGLLGTIHGLIISFGGMQGADAATRQSALSKGVAVAFYNTFFGLSVATVTVAAYIIVSSRQGRELTRMEHATARILDQILTTPGGKGAEPLARRAS